MWGVSWANVMLMMADAQRTDYDHGKSKGESIMNSRTDDVLDLSDPLNIEKLMRLAR